MRFFSRFAGVISLAFVLDISVTSCLSAEEEIPSRWATTFRIQPPFSQVSLYSVDGGWGAGGGSIAERFMGFVEAELGFNRKINPVASGYEVVARAGIVPVVLPRIRRDESQWTLRLPILAGYHHLHVSGGDPREVADGDGLAVSTGIALARRLSRHWSVEVRGLAAMGYSWGSNTVAGPSSGRMAELGGTAGLSYE